MDIHGLAMNVASIMKENDIRKSLATTRHTLHITDDEGNCADFVLKKKDTAVLFTVQDIETILKASIQAIEAALQKGECISARGFGRLEVKYREPRRTRDFDTGEWIDVEGRFIPKFTFGSDLRTAARLYQCSLEEGNIETRIDREGLGDEDFE